MARGVRARPRAASLLASWSSTVGWCTDDVTAILSRPWRLNGTRSAATSPASGTRSPLNAGATSLIPRPVREW